MSSIQVLTDNLWSYPRTFITVETLQKMSGMTNYAAFYDQMQALLSQGVLRPAGGSRDTNGLIPPLQRKYRILHPEIDLRDEGNEIMLLSPLLQISGYLKNRALYRKHRDILLPLSAFLKTRQHTLRSPMSKNERAYAIWRNEKALDDSRYQSVLRYNQLESFIQYYQTPEPFFDYLCAPAGTGDILILENKDIWFTLRKLLIQAPEKRRLFGLTLDGLLYGEGKKAARPGALTEYAALSGCRHRYWYCGDIDFEGFSIFEAVCRANPNLPISLFAAGYHAMVQRGLAEGTSPCPKQQEPPDALDSVLSGCLPEDRSVIKLLLERGHYIPQECLNYPFLREAMEA